MKIAFFEITDMERGKFESALNEHELKFFKEPIQEVPITEYADVDTLCIFIYSKVSRSIIENLKNLKLIVTRSTGTDHIDTSYCRENNITVKNVPIYGENTVAEHTFALILSLSRKIHMSYVKSTQGEFSTEGLQGFDLKGKTLGIIGGGRIGLHVARMAKSFGMHVRVYDINKDEFLAELINFKYVDFNQLLSESDIVSLHLPLNNHTYHIINGETLSLMKKNSILINTARGGLVDTESLIKALDNGHLYGAGLDVIEGEEFLIEENIFNSPVEKASELMWNCTDDSPCPPEYNYRRLTENENVVMTPHNAFNSIEAVERIIDTTISNIIG